ncbi:MAG TPA: hypothetical protein VGQ83_05890 [Polyangia bacterium]|jgi:hypothetical protein
MAGWQVALLVLAAVFVGMWIPVSLQLWATLRSGQKFLEGVGSRGAETLARLSDTAVGLKETIADVGELARSANELKDSIRMISSIGAAVGPAVVALIRALREEPAAAEARAGNGAAPISEPRREERQ